PHAGERKADLFTRFGRDRRRRALAVALHDHLDGHADLHRVERIGVIVNIGDLLPGEFHDDVATFQSRLFRRARAADAAELHAFDVARGIIRDRPEIRAKGLAPAGL